MYGANVVVFEGIMAFTNRKLLDILDLKIFVDTDSDIRLARRYNSLPGVWLISPTLYPTDCDETLRNEAETSLEC